MNNQVTFLEFTKVINHFILEVTSTDMPTPLVTKELESIHDMFQASRNTWDELEQQASVDIINTATTAMVQRQFAEHIFRGGNVH